MAMVERFEVKCAVNTNHSF